jgi:hypothetical protein
LMLPDPGYGTTTACGCGLVAILSWLLPLVSRLLCPVLIVARAWIEFKNKARGQGLVPPGAFKMLGHGLSIIMSEQSFMHSSVCINILAST